MTRLSGINLFMKKMEMEDEGFVPIGLDMGENVGEFDQEKDSKFALKKYLTIFIILQAGIEGKLLKLEYFYVSNTIWVT